jgi:hypothetical protein
MTRTVLSMPLAYASALDRAAVRLRSRHRSSYVEARWSPESSRRFGNSECKSSGVLRSVFTTGRNGWELFSLRRGLESSYVFFKLGITSAVVRFASETTKATLWVALDSMVMRLGN